MTCCHGRMYLLREKGLRGSQFLEQPSVVPQSQPTVWSCSESVFTSVIFGMTIQLGSAKVTTGPLMAQPGRSTRLEMMTFRTPGSSSWFAG